MSFCLLDRSFFHRLWFLADGISSTSSFHPIINLTSSRFRTATRKVDRNRSELTTNFWLKRLPANAPSEGDNHCLCAHSIDKTQRNCIITSRNRSTRQPPNNWMCDAQTPITSMSATSICWNHSLFFIPSRMSSATMTITFPHSHLTDFVINRFSNSTPNKRNNNNKNPLHFKCRNNCFTDNSPSN